MRRWTNILLTSWRSVAPLVLSGSPRNARRDDSVEARGPVRRRVVCRGKSRRRRVRHEPIAPLCSVRRTGGTEPETIARVRGILRHAGHESDRHAAPADRKAPQHPQKIRKWSPRRNGGQGLGPRTTHRPCTARHTCGQSASFYADPAVPQIVAMHRLHEAAEFRRARAAILLPHGNRPKVAAAARRLARRLPGSTGRRKSSFCAPTPMAAIR